MFVVHSTHTSGFLSFPLNLRAFHYSLPLDLFAEEPLGSSRELFKEKRAHILLSGPFTVTPVSKERFFALRSNSSVLPRDVRLVG